MEKKLRELYGKIALKLTKFACTLYGCTIQT